MVTEEIHTAAIRDLDTGGKLLLCRNGSRNVKCEWRTRKCNGSSDKYDK